MRLKVAKFKNILIINPAKAEILKEHNFVCFCVLKICKYNTILCIY